MMKLFAALVALAGLAVAVAIVVGGHRNASDNHPVPLTVASPADSFIVHDAPPPAPNAASPTPGAPPAAPAAPTQDSLDAAIERLRAAAAAKPDAPATPPGATPPGATPPGATPPGAVPPGAAPAAVPPAATVTPPAATATVDPSALASSPPPPVTPPPPPPSWTAVTSQGARWRINRDPGGPAVVIDMGRGRTATVQVDPAFLALPQDGANSRVDFLKQTILESFPPGSSQFRFARDGSVSLLR